MIALLEDGLQAGALGMSSGLFTPPGSYAQPDEMIAFGHVLKRYNAGYFTHLRDESNQVMEAVEEAIEVAEQCGVHVEIVHFKCSGMDNWGKAATGAQMIAGAKARGLDVDCDAYPYAAGSNPLKNLLPQWVQAGGEAAMLARLKQPETRARIRTDIARDGLNNWGRIPSWDACRSRSRRTCRSIGQDHRRAAPSAGPTRSTWSATISSRTTARPACWSHRSPRTTSSTSCARPRRWSAPTAIASRLRHVGQGMPHPRFYGTFPRIIDHYVREEACCRWSWRCTR